MDASVTPSQPKNRRNLIIIAVVVGVLLCCCCALALGAAGWFCGDMLTGLSSTCAP